MTGRNASIQGRDTLAYFRQHASSWRKKAESPGDNVDVLGQRFNYVLNVSERHKHPGPALDLGCGSGELTIQLAARGIPATGVDFAAEMIEIANKHPAMKGAVSCRFVHGSVFDFDPVDAPYGLIAALGLIEYLTVSETERLFSLCRSLLRSDGRFVVGSRNRLFNAFSLNAYTRSELSLGTLTALVEEATVISEAPSMAECLGALRSHCPPDIEMNEHPDTGIDVTVRHQFTPAQLIQMLERSELKAVTLSPVHYHGMTPRLKASHPEIHKSISEGLHPSVIEAHPAIPFSSTFLIAARPV